MKRICLLLSIHLCLIACAGNPPAWWNPRNVQPGQSTAKQRAASQTAAVSSTETANMSSEELISVSQEEYEEMQLTPLQDEEQENTTGETSSQIMQENETDLLLPSVLDE